ncbi:malate dehydrogenase [Rhabdochlamydiaceae symbiont of Dictyostelium giganteum]|uniref:malate dehydrogenase n=1 Tax=Rhabdochlamydiaceae symbiont of Dictyostelium giganteum TaxID=3342349 RepID=UPI00384AF2DE
MAKGVKKVAVTGACGQIAYSLIFLIASGQLFGQEQNIDLHLLDVKEAMPRLKGVEMELLDCAFPLLNHIIYGDDAKKVLEGVDTVFLLGSKPRGPGMERRDLLQDNGHIFAEQGKILEQVAASPATLLVVGNPCHTNCLILQSYAKSHHCYAMTQLDANRATSLLAQKAKVNPDLVKRMIIWGNHSLTQVVDYSYVTIQGKRAKDVIEDHIWLEHTFPKTVQERGGEVILARGKSSAASAAKAALETMQSLLFPTDLNGWFSVGLLSDHNPYGVHEGIVFSFPCQRTLQGNIQIVPSLELSSSLREKIKRSEEELLEEKRIITALLGS